MKFLSDILAKAGLVVDGTVTLNSVANATTDTDRFIVVESGVVKYRTGTQLLSDIGGISGNQTITLSGDATGSGTTSIAVTLANSGVVAGTYGSSTAVPVITVDAKGRVTGVTTASISGSLTFTGDVTGSGTTGSTTTLTLANSGVTAGTYTKVTVDAKGRVTVGASLASGDLPSHTHDDRYYTETESDTRFQLASQKGQANGYASLDGAGKVPVSQLPSSIMEYKGTWNASTNSPTLADGTGDTGDVYRVSTAGTRNLGSGSITFDIGDYVIYNGTVWEKSDTTDAVASVNGFTGIITLTTTNIGEGTNLYYTDTRARAALSFTAGSGGYNSTTGVITIPTNTNQLTNGAGYITGNQNITLSGDVTGSGATSIVTTIANNAVTTAKINNGAITASKMATFGAGEGFFWAANTDGASIIFESTGDGASGGRALSNLLIALTDNGDEGLKVTTTGSELLYVNINQFQYKGNNVWHSGNLTNLNQLSNGPGYITGYTETDTLASVTGRGASTNTNVTFNGTITANSSIVQGYGTILTGYNSGFQITVNATYSGGQTNTYTPQYAGVASAGMFVMKQRNGGEGIMDFYGKQSGTDGSTQAYSTFNHLMTMLPTGYVGVGTVAPGAKLDIVSTASGSEGLRVDGASGGFAFVVRGGSTYTSHIRAGLTIGANYFTTPPSNGAIIEGNVGIGTTTPSYKLELVATNNQNGFFVSAADTSPFNAKIATFRYAANANDVCIEAQGGKAAIQARAGASTMDLLLNAAGGYVAIGTTSPATPLHVLGGPAGTGSWNRTATLAATYPALIFNSNGSKWAGIAYDYSAAMRFWVNASNDDVFAATLALSILNSGYIGIGTSTPQTSLTLSRTNVSYAGQLQLASDNFAQITFYNSAAITPSAANRKASIIYNVAGNTFEIANQISGGHLILQGSDSGGGRVGINIDAPQAILDVSHTAGTTNIIRVSNGAGNYRWRVDQNFSMIMTNSVGTDTFSVTTGGVLTAVSLVKSGGTSSQFLMADGSVSTNPGWITSYTETDTLATVTSRGNTTTGRINVRSNGNQGGGNILMGNTGNGSNKWSYLTGTHYNQDTQTQGVSIIGAYSDINSNVVVIGGSIYEANPATEIQFWTHTATTHNLGGSKRMVIDTNGNVGINSPNPTYTLHVGGSGYFNSTLYVNGQTTLDDQVNITSGYSVNFGSSRLHSTDTSYFLGGNVGIAVSNPANKLQIGSVGSSGYSGNDLAIGNGTQVMAFFQSSTVSTWYTNTSFSLMPSGAGSTGNLGVGTTSPNYRLDVRGNIALGDTSTNPQIIFTGASVNGFTNGYISWNAGTNSTAALTLSVPGNNFEVVTGYNERVVLSTGNGLYVYTNNGSGTYTNRLTLDRTGNLTISGTLTEQSALRYKENIAPVTAALEKVDQLQPVSYNKKGSSTKEIGLIAEDVFDVYPEFVLCDDNGEPVGIHYSRLTAVLIESVKELKTRIQELEKRN
jgi:hypothetical protein